MLKKLLFCFVCCVMCQTHATSLRLSYISKFLSYNNLKEGALHLIRRNVVHTCVVKAESMALVSLVRKFVPVIQMNKNKRYTTNNARKKKRSDDDSIDCLSLLLCCAVLSD